MQKDFSKINVLVVDDMATAREYISKQLRDIGVINISTNLLYLLNSLTLGITCSIFNITFNLLIKN